MNKEKKSKECPIPCQICWQTDGEACFDSRCPLKEKKKASIIKSWFKKGEKRKRK